MLVDFIYDNPIWLWGGILVILVTVVSCLGLLIVHRYIGIDVRVEHNEASQAMISVVGTAYAVLIAFIAVAAWQSFTDADKAADDESSQVANLYWDTAGLTKDAATTIRDEVRLYIHQVIDSEWPAQRKGEVIQTGRAALQHIHETIVSLNPATAGEAVVQAELLHTMNGVYSARRTRQRAAEGAVPPIVWSIIFLGTALTIGFTFLLGAPSLRMHLVMTALGAVSLSLVIVLIVALDRPFRGDLSVGPDAYENVLTVIGQFKSAHSGP